MKDEKDIELTKYTISALFDILFKKEMDIMQFIFRFTVIIFTCGIFFIDFYRLMHGC